MLSLIRREKKPQTQKTLSKFTTYVHLSICVLTFDLLRKFVAENRFRGLSL